MNVALVAVIKQGAPAADGIGNAVVLNDAQNAWHKQNARDAEAEYGFECEQEEIFDRDAPAAGEQTHKEVDDRECHHADEEIIIHDARGSTMSAKMPRRFVYMYSSSAAKSKGNTMMASWK